MNSGSTARRPFAFVIPVYNHPLYVTEVIEGVKRYGCPVIVVNDGSTDETAACLERIPDIHLLSHPVNQGKGAAIRTGFEEAARLADWAITVDADGQHDPADATLLMKAALDNPGSIIIGRREGMKEQQAPWTSRFGRQFSNFWVLMASGAWLSDSQSGFRIYPLPHCQNLGVVSKRFQFEVEILVKARWQRIPMIEIPIRVKYKKEIPRISHFHPFIDFLRNTTTFTRLILQRLLIPPPLRRRKYANR